MLGETGLLDSVLGGKLAYWTACLGGNWPTGQRAREETGLPDSVLGGWEYAVSRMMEWVTDNTVTETRRGASVIQFEALSSDMPGGRPDRLILWGSLAITADKLNM
jgi:hypothetical protein